MKNILRLLDKIAKPRIAYAHCDVPCGIYDPKPAQIAAETVAKMVEKIGSLPNENPTVADRNLFVRAVLTKEEHAQKCKEELLILWTDFFKPEHLSMVPDLHEIFKPEHLVMFPDLHDKFWQATKLCSQNKQSVDEKAAAGLVAACGEIAEMFNKAKEAANK